MRIIFIGLVGELFDDMDDDVFSELTYEPIASAAICECVPPNDDKNVHLDEQNYEPEGDGRLSVIIGECEASDAAANVSPNDVQTDKCIAECIGNAAVANNVGVNIVS